MTTAAAYCRLTVLAPRVTVDVALPADVPVAELVPMVLQLVGEPAAGGPLRPWRLHGPAGGPLPPAATLAQLGVHDGELLRIAADGATPAPPAFDDPVDALASSMGPMGPARRRCAGILTLVLVAAGAAVLAAAGGALAASAAALAAVGAVIGVARSAGDQFARWVTALAAVPLAAAAGWAAAPGAAGAVRLLLAALAAGVVAAAAQLALRVIAPVLVAVVTAAVAVAAGGVAVAWFATAPGTTAAAVGVIALVVGPMLPRAALRLSGLPRPVVPADGSELTEAGGERDTLSPAELADRADLARGFLAGLVGGCAPVAAGGAIVAAAAGGWAGPALAAVTAAVLALRARGFANAAPSCTLLACAATTAVLLAWLSVAATPFGGLIAPAVLLVTAALVLAALHRPHPTASPVARRAVDFLEAGLTVAAVPLALAAMNLFAVVRGLDF